MPQALIGHPGYFHGFALDHDPSTIVCGSVNNMDSERHTLKICREISVVGWCRRPFGIIIFNTNL